METVVNTFIDTTVVLKLILKEINRKILENNEVIENTQTNLQIRSEWASKNIGLLIACGIVERNLSNLSTQIK